MIKNKNELIRGEVILDCRILRAFKNRGFIISYDLKFKYVTRYNLIKNGFEINEFYYKNETYTFKYFNSYLYIIKINKSLEGE